MNSNRIPESMAPLLCLATQAGNGASVVEEAVDLKHSTAESITADRERLEAAQSIYLQARAAHAAARRQLRPPMASGRLFCANAVDMLKSHLGRRWNARWLAVGFLSGSIALPTDPLHTLRQLAAYFREHSEHENAPLQISAAQADLLVAALVNARTAADAAHAAEADAKRVRDLAFRGLRHRLSAVRSELALLLSPTDARWYRFGFHRPADSRCPEPVAEVIVRETADGEAIVTWPAAVRAENYRVTWRPTGDDSAPEQVGLFTDRQAILRLLPAETAIIIAVSARNRVGESPARESAFRFGRLSAGRS